jgi:hypothetical protein
MSAQTFLVMGHDGTKVVEYDVMEGKKITVIPQSVLVHDKG